MMIISQGILPEILEELITARKRAKADLKVINYSIHCGQAVFLAFLCM